MQVRSSYCLVALCVLVLCPACSTDAARQAADAARDSGQQASEAGQDSGSPTTVAPAVDAGRASDSGGDDPDPAFTGDARTALASLHYDANAVPVDPSNKFADSPAARSLGQRLFFETALSGRLLEPDNDGSASTLGHAGEAGRVNCAACHVPTGNFVDVRSPHGQISLAAQWTTRRAPTLLEVAFAPLYNWDGRRDTIWNQAIGVFESAGEFNSSRLFIARQIFKLYRTEYEAVFGALPPLDDAARFPQLAPLETGCAAGPTAPCRGKPGDGADYDKMKPDDQVAVTRVTVNVAKALAAYVSQLRCGPARFEQWLDGDKTALSRSEQRGAALFVGRGKCVSCHSGPNLTDGKFHNVGLRPATVAVAFTDIGDRGEAQGVEGALGDPLNSSGAFSDGARGFLANSVSPEMEGAFRTPTLRCVAGQPSFMHTGQLTSLSRVMRFFAGGGDPAGFPGQSEIATLGLDEREQADLTAFIGALEGSGPDAALLAPPAK